MIPIRSFWSNKSVLVTGHTGFKGTWLSLWLKQLGARVAGIALEPNTTPSLFNLSNISEKIDNHICDIRDKYSVKKIILNTQPDIVFHLAAQPLVRASYRDPLTTIETNVLGSTYILDSLREIKSLRVAVMVTTDKVYQNKEWAYPYREEDHLGGHDPYSASKAASEIIIASYYKSFLQKEGVAVASARAGNVIGGGDWSEDRLIPDAIRAWQLGQPLIIRSPNSIRPWQHVLEPLSGYLLLAQKLWENPILAGAYNFGPETSEAATVRQVVEIAQTEYSDSNVIYGEANDGPHEARWLSLEIAKARNILGYKPRWSLDEAIRRTIRWYRSLNNGNDSRRLCEEEINAFNNAA